MPKWQVNLQPQRSQSLQRQYQQLPEPFGFSTSIAAPSVEAPRKKDLIESKLFEVATSAKSQILMTIFMFWMFGNNISIFVLFPIIQSLSTAVTGLLNISKVFEPFQGMIPSLFKYKLMYGAIYSILLGIVLYKLSMMGLLPVSAADYVDLIPPYETTTVILNS